MGELNTSMAGFACELRGIFDDHNRKTYGDQDEAKEIGDPHGDDGDVLYFEEDVSCFKRNALGSDVDEDC